MPHPIFAANPRHPDSAPYNRRLDHYRQAIESTGNTFGISVIDIGRSPAWKYTTCGFRLTSYGQRLLAQDLCEQLGYPRPAWRCSLDIASGQTDLVNVTRCESTQYAHGWTWVLQDRYLPEPYPPDPAKVDVFDYGEFVVKNLVPGTYQLLIDDLVVVTANADQWERGIRLPLRGGWRQVEILRRLVGRKNELYFHRYRPQNETYLFLFRKHEQGNNAVEIPQFDPLTAEVEQRIERWRIPQPHVYQLLRVPR